MSDRSSNRHIFTVVRILICVAALWLVLRGVTLMDTVTLTNGEQIFGRVTDRGDEFVRMTVDGSSQEIALATIQSKDDGTASISYGLMSALAQTVGWLLVVGVLAHLPVAFFQAIRLCWLLKAQQIPLGYWESLKLTFAGNFLNFATPLGSNAGDVFKAYFVALHTDHKTEAATTVFLDRVVGLCSLLLVVALITILSPAERLVSLRPYMLGVLGIVVAGIVFYLSPLFRALLQLSWLRRLPFFGQLERIDMTARNLFGRPGLLVAGVAITLVLQATAMSAYFIVAKAVGLDVLLEQIAEVFAYFFVGCLVQALPGPPQGLGTVELTYRYFFSPFGTVSQILCMAFLIRLMVLLCAVPGVLVTMTGSYRPSTSEPETETELGPKTTDLASASEAVVR